jgi:tetratricopeptide (TPR) repeat protein
MFRPEVPPGHSVAAADTFGEAQRLHRAAHELESHHDPSRYVESLKVYLAFVEEHRAPLAPHAEELSRELDEVAMTLYRLSAAELAGRAVELGLGFAPTSATLLHHKALVLLTQNRNLEFVLPLLERASALSPHDKGIWTTTGDALRIQGRPEAAIEAYLRAQQLDPGSMQNVDRALKIDPNHAGALRMKLELSRTHGAERKALEACEELLRQHPDDAELILTKADILVALGQLEEASRALEQIRPARADDARTSAVHARLLFALGHHDEALAECRRLLATSHTSDPALLADLAERAGRLPTDRTVALDLRQRLREIDPRNVANLQALRALAIEAHRLDLAIDAANALLEVSPHNLEAMRTLAELLLSSGKADAAFHEYREIVARHPRQLGELRKAMVAAQSAERPELLREFAEAILKESPEDLPAREQLAHALAETGKPEEALAAVDRLLERKPSDLRYLLEKKRLLAELGRSDALPAVYDELFRLDPTRSDIALERGNLYLGRAFHHPEGSLERAEAARTALVSYERASLSTERRSSALLGLARAARVVHLPDRAVQAYSEFLGLPGNDRRADAHKELGHILREANRYRDAEVEYTRAIQLGLDDPDLLWGEVEVLTLLTNENSALRYLDLLLLKEPHNPLFLRRKGQLLLKTGRRTEALAALTSAVEAAKGDPQIYFEIAGALRAQGAYVDAIEYYEHGLELDPKSRAGRLAFAEALLQAGRYDEVLPQVDQLLHEDANDLGAWRVRADAHRALNRPADLLYSLQAILLLDPHHGAALREKAELHLADGQRPDAFQAFQQLLASGAPEAADPQLWLRFADLAADLGRVEEAGRAYDRAGSMDPTLVPEIATRRARLRLQAGRPDLALELLDALRVPEGVEVPASTKLLRAEVLGALERPAEAQAVFEEIRRADPHHRPALAGLGRMLLDQGHPDRARELLREGIAQGPPDAPLFLLLAEAESALGSVPAAIGVLEQAVTALPESVPLWSRLAEAFVRREEWAKAADALAHAMALDPKSAELPLRAGFVAEKLGHAHEALALYEHASQIAPANKYAWSSRGLALLGLGRPDEATTSFDRALGLDSDFEAAKDGRRAALQKTRESQVERFGRDALLLEARIGRPVTRNDLFVTLHVPYDLLDPVLAALGRTPKIEIPRLTEQEMNDFETASCQLVTSALEHRPEGIERRGFTLGDVAVLAPSSYSLAELQRLFGYIRSVLELDLRAENLTLTPDVEDLARRALVLPEEQRTLFQLVRTLRVGLFKAKVIKIVERAGGAVHAPLPSVDLAAYSPEFREPLPAGDGGPAPEGEAAGGPSAAGPAFFPVDDEAPPAATGAPALSSPPASHAPPTGARCVGCGGIASVLHSCGAPLCHHCIAQYTTCPKCGQVVDEANSRALGGPATPAAPAHHAPEPARAPAARGSTFRSLFGRSKVDHPPKGPPPAARSASPEPASPAPGAGPRVPPGPASPRGAPAGSEPLPHGEPSPRVVAPGEPPAPPPAPRTRERRDDEPRL